MEYGMCGDLIPYPSNFISVHASLSILQNHHLKKTHFSNRKYLTICLGEPTQNGDCVVGNVFFDDLWCSSEM